jgi:ferrous iron transport protein A
MTLTREICQCHYFFKHVMIMIIINNRLGEGIMTLSQAKRGQILKIVAIPQEQIRAQAIRFGIGTGSRVECGEKLPDGPVVIFRGKQQIAIGRRLAENIMVEWA